ncbi:hypothetical protein IJ182_01010 [bacterium]|nr:hypothetical protein [bacterium]
MKINNEQKNCIQDIQKKDSSAIKFKDTNTFNKDKLALNKPDSENFSVFHKKEKEPNGMDESFFPSIHIDDYEDWYVQMLDVNKQ